MANNNYPQITSVTSEALQAQIRALLPSQEGFGTDLMAQNVIVPIIDLTAAAEGSSLPVSLQQAISVDGDRFVSTSNAAGQVVSTTTGFNRCFGNILFMQSDTGGAYQADLHLWDGTTKFDVFHTAMNNSVAAQTFNTLHFDFIYFAKSGVSLRYDGASFSKIALSTRQIATVTGVLVNPTGFTPQ